MNIDYSKIGDVKAVNFLFGEYDYRQKNYFIKAVYDALVGKIEYMDGLNITLWYSSEEIRKGFAKVEADYEGCYTEEIKKAEGILLENYDTEWVIELGF